MGEGVSGAGSMAQFRHLRCPLTSTLSEGVLLLIRTASPAHVEEHLVQGWDALADAGTERDGAIFGRLMAFARMRLAGAQAGLSRVKGARKAQAAAAEVGHFARLIEGTR